MPIPYTLSPFAPYAQKTPNQRVGRDRDTTARRVIGDSSDNIPIESEYLESAVEASPVCSDTSETYLPGDEAREGRARRASLGARQYGCSYISSNTVSHFPLEHYFNNITWRISYIETNSPSIMLSEK